jgi:hypothetical protein
MKTFITFMLLCTVFLANGQNSASHQVTVNVSQVLDIRFHVGFTPNLDFNFNTVNKLNNGIERIAAAALQVRSNKSWMVSAKAQSQFFDRIPAGPNVMSCSIVKIRKTLAPSGYFSLSTVDQQLTSGTKGGWDVLGNYFTLDYDITPGLNYDEGTYTLPVVFTITAN